MEETTDCKGRGTNRWDVRKKGREGIFVPIYLRCCGGEKILFFSWWVGGDLAFESLLCHRCEVYGQVTTVLSGYIILIFFFLSDFSTDDSDDPVLLHHVDIYDLQLVAVWSRRLRSYRRVRAGCFLKPGLLFIGKAHFIPSPGCSLYKWQVYFVRFYSV